MVNSSSTEKPQTVAVVGGGISGLVCARRLSQQGARVTLFESTALLGGEIRTATIAGHLVDMGAEAVHLAAPGMSSLLNELELINDLINSNPGTSWLWTRRGLRHLPAGVGPAGPRRLRPVVRSGVMSLRGLLRAGLEPVIPRRTLTGDISVGEYVSQRFGRQVVERFVDPVLGSLHAGNVNKLSLRTITPELATIANSRASIMMSRRGQKSGPPLSFATWMNGLPTLIERLLVGTDVEIKTSTTVESVSKLPDGRFRVQASNGSFTDAHAVVLAVPSKIAANIVRQLSPAVSEILRQMRYATVATAIIAYPRAEVEHVSALNGTGLLVPSSRGRLLKAATFLSTKWPHLVDPKYFLVRLSSGRADEHKIENLDDYTLVAKLHNDLVDATGITAEPVLFHVQRWPEAIPQLEVGHLERVSKMREELGRHPGVLLAGASFDGIGIAACIRSGEQAALSAINIIKKSFPQSDHL